MLRTRSVRTPINRETDDLRILVTRLAAAACQRRAMTSGCPISVRASDF